MTLRDSSPLTAAVLAPAAWQPRVVDALAALGLRTASATDDGDTLVTALAARAPDVWAADASLLTRALCERIQAGEALQPALLVVDDGGRWAPADAEALAAHAGAAGFWPAGSLAPTPEAAAVRAEALTRVRETVFARRSGAPDARTVPAGYARRLAVPDGGLLRFVPVAAVTHITAAGTGAAVHVGGEALAVRETLAELERRLDPADFCRIHRSTIVRLGAVEALRTAPGGDYEVALVCGARLSLARGRRETFVARLALG